MLDLTADGLRVREERDRVREDLAAARARAADFEEALQKKEDERARERQEVQAIRLELKTSHRTAADITRARTDARVAEARADSMQRETERAVGVCEQLAARLSEAILSERKLEVCRQELALLQAGSVELEEQARIARAAEDSAYARCALLQDQVWFPD